MTNVGNQTETNSRRTANIIEKDSFRLLPDGTIIVPNDTSNSNLSDYCLIFCQQIVGLSNFEKFIVVVMLSQKFYFHF
jgi:hypothetical protein